jgi:hypothetical protein
MEAVTATWLTPLLKPYRIALHRHFAVLSSPFENIHIIPDLRTYSVAL